jgi:putative Ca2+/H+ antiporter (TMEM165/GDT1 family)
VFNATRSLRSRFCICRPTQYGRLWTKQLGGILCRFVEPVWFFEFATSSGFDLDRICDTTRWEITMDWRVFLTTFGVIFLAEMGDKTQLAAMTMSAQTKKPWAVFIGSALALTAVSAIGVMVGSVVGNYVPLEWIKRTAAVAFIVIGILILLDKF